VPDPQYPNLSTYTWTGGTLKLSISGSLNGSGSASVSIPSNTAIIPGTSKWQIQVCPAATAACYIGTPVIITGSTQTVNLTPPAISITLINPPGAFTTAYADGEITSTPIGGSYFNLTTSQTRTCTAVTGTTCNTWASAGGGASGVSAVTGTSPIVSSGGATPAISCPTCNTSTIVKVCSQVAVVMPTSAVTSGNKSTAATGTCTGLTTSDSISCTSSVELFSVTGFVPSASGILTISAWPTSNTINVEYANNTAGSITPGALTLNCGAFR